jgi:hypothetical protein
MRKALLIRRLKGDLTLPFFALSGFLLLYSLMPTFLEAPLSFRAGLLARVAVWVGISWWLIDDARRMRFTLPMNYGMLMLFYLPFFAPVYLFQTRGLMAFVSIALYAFTMICITAVSYVVYSS